MQSDVAEAIDRNFTSPNVSDANSEPANLVDTTQAIAAALGLVAESIERLAAAVERAQRGRPSE
jgi:hypothetical protein